MPALVSMKVYIAFIVVKCSFAFKMVYVQGVYHYVLIHIYRLKWYVCGVSTGNLLCQQISSIQHNIITLVTMDGGAWWAAVHGVMKSRTRLSDFPFIFHFHALEREMETHSSVLAWRIPGRGEPGGLPSMGSHRVGHD